VLKTIAGFFRSKPEVSFSTSEYGNYYAKLPRITASLQGDACPLLRVILKSDLGCEKIREVSGDGDTWWDFRYRDVQFTCLLLVASCGGSEIYPSSCTKSSPEERKVLDELAPKIADYAQKRKTAS
jgi:hypothetical protein